MNKMVFLGRLTLILLTAVVLFFSGFFITPATVAKPFQSSMPTVVDPGYKIQILVPGSYFHGIHGLTFDSQDNLYAGSVIGESIYHVNTDTGDISVFIGPPNGMADDLEFGPDGRIYYTSFLMGKVHAKSADGKVTVLAEGLPGIYRAAWHSDRPG